MKIMKECVVDEHEFPGFQTCIIPKDEFAIVKRPLSRLQRRAPRPLQLKPSNSSNNNSLDYKGALLNKLMDSSESSALYSSCCHSKDPIPLLSPLVLPSLLESTTKSH
ncbi:hypothetical protein MTR67_000969 [Solanum verrucosum]|uniref:Uncharacterized protein n=1 Tax=Solanum verrucosum TaxID=315347 RepID=A0AAF0T7F7_SOLVR|nr:hypothetical protein MTR67_000969 [Solanum verrucosum]